MKDDESLPSIDVELRNGNDEAIKIVLLVDVVSLSPLVVPAPGVVKPLPSEEMPLGRLKGALERLVAEKLSILVVYDKPPALVDV